MKRSVIGIDIGNNEVKMVQFSGGNVRMCAERLPENLVRENMIVSPELMAKFLRDTKAKHKFRGRKCAVILPEYSTYFRALSMPVMTESQLKLNLPYEFRDYVGTDSIDYFYDYCVENIEYDEDEKPIRMNLIAGAAQKSTVDEYASLVHKAGMQLSAAIPREMALIYLLREAVQNGLDPNKEYGLVDIGYEHTRVYIFAGEQLRASKIIDIGCLQLDEAISAMMNVDVYLASTYRQTNYDGVLDMPACRNVYDQVSLEIMKAINFYKYENGQSEICDVFFSGSGAGAKQLVDEIVSDIQFEKRDISELLPESCNGNVFAASCVLATGAAL